MNKSLLTIMLLMSFSSYGQIATAPNSSANISAPPVGMKRTSNCSKKGCFEIKVLPYCFGTNLRGYSHDIQLKPDEDVKIDVSIGGSSGDNVNIQFPARLTYAADGTTPVCQGISSNMNTSGTKQFKCSIPGSGDLVYSIADWRGSKNPSCFANGGYRGQEYCDYAARPLTANLVSGTHPETQITCVYVFGSDNKIKPEVKCIFESEVADESSNVAVSKDGGVLVSEIKAFTNNISVKIPLTSMSWVNSHSELREGKRMMPKSGESLQSPLVSFFQVGANGDRPLEKSDYQLPDKVVAYDSVNNNMSLTIVAKFPGSEGFCGGFYSPLMLFFDKELPKFNGISSFPLHGVREGGRVNWPEAESKGYFLALLNEGEKEISKASQLFGQDGKFENGFEALKVHDSDKNAVINSKDKIWSSLRLWRDANSNGFSEPDEIVTLDSKGVQSIGLTYTNRNPMKFGNRARARERSTFTFKKGKKVQTAEILDVWFSPID